MAKSNKARYGTKTKTWKDTVFASRSQAQARSKRKQVRSQQERARGKATLTDEEFRERASRMMAEEAAQPLSWWWLSFCDSERGQFLGACLVKAHGMISAVQVAHALGINPGGEVLGHGPIPLESKIQDG